MSNHLELMRDSAKAMPATTQPKTVETARIWHCKYQTLGPVAKLRNLRGLVIATYPDDELQLLSELNSIEYLSILHLPKVTDLAPLAALNQLQVLRLATLPSWDSSGKTTTVNSLAPLAQLQHLTSLELFGVMPLDQSLSALESCASLASVRVNRYPASEVERFRSVTGVADECAPEPWF